MATRTFVPFYELAKDLGSGVHDFTSDTLKAALVAAAASPAANDATPRWSDYSGNEVSGTGYTAGGEALASVSWTQTTDTATLTSGDERDPSVSWAQNGAGPTNVRYLILYNDDASNDEAIGFIDFGVDVSLQEGPIEASWGTNGVFDLVVESLMG